jgi:RNA polymerase sigma-70 factor (ECF subfamily)
MRADIRAEDAPRDRFEAMYTANFDRVAAYLLARADPEEAAEALARTFEIAWRRFARVPDEPLPWLLGVGRRVLADLRRGRRRRDALLEGMAGVAPGWDADHAERYLQRDLLVSALGELTEDQREALLLLHWDGLSQREAAAVLNCSRGALALKLHRARKRLQRSLRTQGLESSSTEMRSHTGHRTAAHPATKEIT